MLVALFAACVFLTIVYSLVAVFAVQQMIQVHFRDELSVFSSRFWLPASVQRQVLTIVTFLSLTRAAFFVVAIFAWDSYFGEVSKYRSAFYSLDELSIIAFFSLACLLAMFWAEVYYLATDRIDDYRYLVRPITIVLNIGAYVAVIACAYAAIHKSSSYSDYIYWNFSLLVAVLYILAAFVFTYYAYRAATELNAVPVQISSRQERTAELSRIFSIFIVVLIARAILLLLMSNDQLSTDSSLSIFLLVVYFLVLEWLPTVFALAFYRVTTDYETIGNSKQRWHDIEESTEESDPLIFGPRTDHETSISSTRASKLTPGTAHSGLNPNTTSMLDRKKQHKRSRHNNKSNGGPSAIQAAVDSVIDHSPEALANQRKVEAILNRLNDGPLVNSTSPTRSREVNNDSTPI